MRVIKAPAPIRVKEGEAVLFLSGSIEMGTAELWQDRAVELLRKDTGLLVLNPRRDDWDSSWVQSIDNPQFRQQVEWELEGLELCDYAIVCFDPATKSPITLLELGILSAWGWVCEGPEVIIVCPDGFWRKGNVDILAARFKLSLYDNLEEAVAKLQNLRNGR